MTANLGKGFLDNFLGHSATWYKQLIIAFLIINPIVFWISPFVAGWLLILEFILTLAMALKCYPLQPGGLLAAGVEGEDRGDARQETAGIGIPGRG